MRNHKECGNENRDFSRYTEYLYNQVEEICTNYGQIDIIWFDFSYDDMRGEKWGATKLINMVRSLQPQVIIDNRLEASGEGRGSLYECDPTPYHGDFVSLSRSSRRKESAIRKATRWSGKHASP